MAERPLIGLSPDQVSTNGMLGDLAFQDSDSAYIETIRGKVSLDKLDKEITDTAVDIFVYDTRKDSDGGAWRKRTQHTSWYNETLNTSTRGTRREFPAVAVIVAESNQVTIYDGDDPDLPMWMVFNTTDGSMLRSAAITATSMLNGELCVCHTSGSGFHRIWFLKDTARWLTASTGYGGYYGFASNSGGTTIAERNTAGGNYLNNIGGASDIVIVSSNCNDVAMTVLPNAPIDSATGLQVPTIAVATDGGVSIIKDDGTVVDITWSSYGLASSVYFKDNYLWLTNDSGIIYKGGRYLKKYSIPSSDISESHGYLKNSALKYWASPWGFLGSYTGTSYPPLLGSNTGFYGPTVGPYWGSSDGTNGGITFIGDEGTTTTDGLVAYATTSYNTGWMHGDIKGAFLSDTDDTNVTGTELVTNGTFDSDVSGWTAVDATITYSSGTALVNRTGGSGKVAYQTITTVVGETYVLSGTIDSTGTGDRGDIRAYSDNGSTMLVNASGTDNQTVNVSGTFTATTTTTYIYFTIDNSGTATFDNVSVRIAELDRSVNNKGLAVYGTITKSAVATAAELVGYSNFSTSNYLIQPPNSDLAFGNNAFSVMCWFKTSQDHSATNSAILIAGDDGSNQLFDLRVHSDEKLLWQVTDDSFTTRSRIYQAGPAVDDGVWHCVVGTRTSDNKTHLYLDGNLIGSSTSESAEANLSNSIAFSIGVENAYGGTKAKPWGGSIALVRISGSVPSPEQIKKIYEDEKVLFQENAACTLYGSSDAVTALAYDDSTSILYAGTSSGRSDFQGLRRINNTTTAVTTAMSASNGLVAEQ